MEEEQFIPQEEAPPPLNFVYAFPNSVTVKVQGKNYTIPGELGKKFQPVKDMIETLEGLCDDEPIPLPNLTQKNFPFILEFYEWHSNHPEDKVPPNTEAEYMNLENLCEFDAKVFAKDFNPQDWIDFVQEANYLEYQELKHVCLKRLAFLMMKVTIQEMKNLLINPEPLTEEEQERTKKARVEE